MKIGVEIQGLKTTLALLGDQARQVPFATALALNATARGVKAAGIDSMRREFDSPKPITLNSLFIKPATKDQPRAEVFVKDQPLAKGAGGGLAEVLGHQFAGGQRTRKRLESHLQRMGYIGPSEYVAPGPDARMDSYGNISLGQVQQIMTALHLHFAAYQNATRSKRSQRNAKAAGHLFWSQGKDGKRRGVWGTDAQKNLRLILVVIPTPRYKRRIFLDRLAQEVVTRDWASNFDSALARALSSANP